MPWHPVPFRAACTYLRAGGSTCSLPIKLRLLISYVFIIRKLRLAFVVYSGFTNGEYHVIRVDFIVALRRTKGRGRRTLRSPPSPSSGLHLIHPGNPLRRGISAAAVDRDIVSLYPVLSLIPSSEFYLAFCVRAGIVRVSVGLLGWYRLFFIIGGMDCLFLRLRWVLLWSIVGFALTANGAFLWAGNGMGNLCC